MADGSSVPDGMTVNQDMPPRFAGRSPHRPGVRSPAAPQDPLEKEAASRQASIGRGDLRFPLRGLTRVPAKGSAWLKFGLLCVLIAGIVVGLRLSGVDPTRMTPENVRASVLAYGVWAPLVYLVAYSQPFMWLPASVMTMAGGLAFGPWEGMMAALIGATLRACSQFLMARFLGREAVSKFLKGRMAGLDQRIGERGFTTVLLIRLIPNVPFDLQNYALGFSNVRFWPYAAASLLGILPATMAFAYLGHSLTDFTQLWKILLAVVVLVALMAARRAVRR